MKRTILAALLSLWFVLPSVAQEPPADALRISIDVVPAIPAECRTPSDWAAATVCLDKLVEQHPTLVPGAVIGYQQDGAAAQFYAKGAGFTNNSVVSLASVSKPLTNVTLVKLVQDHFDSPDCTPAITPRCVFPQKFETPLAHAVRTLDQRRGTDVFTRWFDRVVTDDAPQQRAWKNAIRIKHIAQLTAGFPPISFTGYRFCPGGVCPDDTWRYDVTCNPDQPGPCRYAFLYNQYLSRRGGSVALPNGCRPRPASGPRLFNFDTYYGGAVDAPGRVQRQFERRYSFEPGLFGECVLVEDASGGRWADGRTVRESDVAKFFLGMPLVSEPGTQYLYSQPHYYVAAFLIEGVSGQRFDDYLKATLLTPLGMNDTSFVVRPGTSQYQRLHDIVRVPTTPARVLPDIAVPLVPGTIYGADKNWDEPREGWTNRWPEGGAYSTAPDLLRFLRFVKDGKAPDGRALLNPESVRLVTTARGPVGPRTYGFRSPAPGVLAGNGYFATYMKRNSNRCYNSTVLLQTITESPEGDAAHRVPLADYQYGDIMRLRGALIGMIEGIRTPCDAASPNEPVAEEESES